MSKTDLDILLNKALQAPYCRRLRDPDYRALLDLHELISDHKQIYGQA